MQHPDVPEELRGTYAGDGPPGDHRPPESSWASPRSSSCRSTSSSTTRTCRTRACATTGATTPSGSSPRTTPTPSTHTAASRCRSSSRWSRPCTRPTSRSSSTWSTTTPRRATTWAPRCASGASTTPRTTGSSTTTRAHYYDTTGTGNSLLMRNPHVLQLIMDSLRYWVNEMHVDGFRFDLAATLARQFHEVDRLSAFFDLVHQDPVISQVKLIAEPWDLGRRRLPGRRVPAAVDASGTASYRDTVRDFWRGEPATLGEFASRLSGSADLYEHTGRRPIASINFVTAHDGFTLTDLVSYNEKHNEANGEGNNDGESHNRRGTAAPRAPTKDKAVLAPAPPPATQLPGHAADLPGRADARPRRRAGPDPAGQQQRLLPGQRAHLGRLGPEHRGDGAPGVHPADGHAPHGAPRAAPPALLRRRGRTTAASPSSATSRGSPRPPST